MHELCREFCVAKYDCLCLFDGVLSLHNRMVCFRRKAFLKSDTVAGLTRSPVQNEGWVTCTVVVGARDPKARSTLFLSAIECSLSRLKFIDYLRKKMPKVELQK